MKFLRRLLIIAAIAALSGCANQITVSSQKSAALTGRMESVLITTQTSDNFIDVGPGYIKYNYYARVFQNLVDMLGKEQVRAEVLKVDKLALNARDLVSAKAKEMNAAYVLTIDVPQRKVRGGDIILQEYDVMLSLQSAKTGETAWVGKVHVVQDWGMMMDAYMKDIASRIVATLKADRLL